jgi:hypothetical protein
MAETEKKVRRSAAEYERLLAEQKASGMTLRAFADLRGLNRNTFYGWHQRLRRLRAADEASKLVRVQVQEGRERDAEDVGPCGPLFELAFPGGRVLRIPPRFDAGELQRLLAALEARC